MNEHKRVEYLLFHILQTQDVLEQCISKEPKHARVIRFGTLKQLFVETENIARVRTTNKPRKNKIYDSGTEKQLKIK